MVNPNGRSGLIQLGWKMSYKKIKSQPLNKVNKCFICSTEHPDSTALLLSAIPAKGNSLFLRDTTVEHLAVKTS